MTYPLVYSWTVEITINGLLHIMEIHQIAMSATSTFVFENQNKILQLANANREILYLACNQHQIKFLLSEG